MALYRVQNTLVRASGLAEDNVVNSFYFESPAPLPDDTDSLAAIVKAFYNSNPATNGVTTALRNILSPECSGGGITKVYLMDDALPRAPKETLEWSWTAPATNGTAMVSEVACCLSFKAAAASGVNAARRRGRVYIGPLSTTAMTVTGNIPRPSVALTNQLIASAIKMRADALAAGFTWVVHSPTTSALARYPVAAVSVDDAFDTQRRRGTKPTGKTTWILA